MWRTTPLHRSETPAQPGYDTPPALPDGIAGGGLQTLADGAGSQFHRLFRVRIRDARLSAAALMERVAADPDGVAPSEFASFEKVRGETAEMAVGDEFVVRMPGPWDGPVRVVDRTPTSFRLATLTGHLEAGQIEFRASDGDRLEFTIEAWARPGDRLSALLYQHLRMSKEVQLHMWTSVLLRVAELAGGRVTGGVEIRTRRGQDPPELNFELGPAAAYTPERGWNVDDLVQPLPPGSWEVARGHLANYRIADPAIVRAAWDPHAPLDGRVMELQLRFRRIVRVTTRVLVTRVWDEQRSATGERIFGFEYATLRGHVEMGRMDYEVSERLDDGRVEFRINAHSRAAGDRAAWIRLGFRLFGRREQVRFYRRCCERMAWLTARDVGWAAPLPPATVRLRDGETPESAGIGERFFPRRTCG